LFKKSREYNFLEFSILKGVSIEIGCNTLDWYIFEPTSIKPKCVSELAVFVTFEKKKIAFFSYLFTIFEIKCQISTHFGFPNIGSKMLRFM